MTTKVGGTITTNVSFDWHAEDSTYVTLDGICYSTIQLLKNNNQWPILKTVKGCNLQL